MCSKNLRMAVVVTKCSFAAIQIHLTFFFVLHFLLLQNLLCYLHQFFLSNEFLDFVNPPPSILSYDLQTHFTQRNLPVLRPVCRNVPLQAQLAPEPGWYNCLHWRALDITMLFGVKLFSVSSKFFSSVQKFFYLNISYSAKLTWRFYR